LASPLLRHFSAETSNVYPTPSPAVFEFVVDAGGREDTPYLDHFSAETSNAYQIPSPAVIEFAVDAGGREDGPALQHFSAETSNAYQTPSPAVLEFNVDTQNFAASDARLSGKQFTNASVASAKLVSAALFVKSDGSVPATEEWSAGGFKLTSVGAPSVSTDLLRKSELDAFVLGAANHKSSARVATAAALPANTRTSNTLTANANGSINTTGIDGVTSLAVTDRVLVKNEALGENNGIYRISNLGSAGTPWVFIRVADMNTDDEATAGTAVTIIEGASYAGTRWVLTTNDPISLNSDSLTFTQVTGLSYATAGAGLTKTGDVLDVGAGDGISATGDALQVISSAIAGTGLEADGFNNLRLAAPGDGLTGGGASVLSVDVSAIAGTGLSTLGNNLRMGAPGNGLTGGNGSALAVLPANGSIDVSASGVKAAVPTPLNKAQAPAATSGNESTTGISLAATPAGGSYIKVRVNGRGFELGDGVKTKDCYFSTDGGTTARSIAALIQGDVLYWNGTIVGFNLATSDKVYLVYVTVI
jgi:hypothetical protein